MSIHDFPSEPSFPAALGPNLVVTHGLPKARVVKLIASAVKTMAGFGCQWPGVVNDEQQDPVVLQYQDSHYQFTLLNPYMSDLELWLLLDGEQGKQLTVEVDIGDAEVGIVSYTAKTYDFIGQNTGTDYLVTELPWTVIHLPKIGNTISGEDDSGKAEVCINSTNAFWLTISNESSISQGDIHLYGYKLRALHTTKLRQDHP